MMGSVVDASVAERSQRTTVRTCGQCGRNRALSSGAGDEMVGGRDSRFHPCAASVVHIAVPRDEKERLCIMAHINIRTALAVTIGLGLAVLGSAAAYGSNHPLCVSSAAQLEVLSNPPHVAVAEPISEGQSVLVLPEITIVGQAFYSAPLPDTMEDFVDQNPLTRTTSR